MEVLLHSHLLPFHIPSSSRANEHTLFSYLRSMSIFQQPQTVSPFTGASQAAIVWPLKYQPGTTDNFISNEIIAKDVTAAQVWAVLSNLTTHKDCSNGFVTSSRLSRVPQISKGDGLYFDIDGYPYDCIVKECVAPERLAWCTKDSWVEAVGEDFYQAWLIESLEVGRVRILSQQSIFKKYGNDAKRNYVRNRRLIGYQDWLEGIVAAAKLVKLEESGGFRPGGSSLFQRLT